MKTEVKKICGQTAGGILKTAHKAKDGTGCECVWVKTKDGGEYQALMTECGELALTSRNETIVMPMSNTARAKLKALLNSLYCYA